MISRDALQVGPPRIRIIIGSDQQIASRSRPHEGNRAQQRLPEGVWVADDLRRAADLILSDSRR